MFLAITAAPYAHSTPSTQRVLSRIRVRAAAAQRSAEGREDAVQAAALLEGGQERLQEFVESLEYEPAAYAAAKQRLEAINELLGDCGCTTTEELLGAAADTRVALARWAEVAGAPPRCTAPPAVPLCLALVNAALCGVLSCVWA